MVDPSAQATAPLRIVYFGTPVFAIPTLDRLFASRHHVCGVVTQPDRPRGRGQRLQPGAVKVTALQHDVPVFQPDRLREPGVAETLGAWHPDLGVVAAYGQIIPENLLALPRLGMINVHPSLLPKYRGAAPVHRAVIAGERETGVTIMRVARALDAGAMLASVRRPIDSDETSEAIERDLSELGASLLVEVVDRLAAGPVHEEPQDEALATYAARLTKAEGLIDWTLPSVIIHNRVRGLHPWPHAYTYLDGQRIIVRATRVLDTSTDAVPGTVVSGSHDEIDVATGAGGRLAVLEVQPEGRRAMPVRDFLAGRAIEPGARFTGAGNRSA